MNNIMSSFITLNFEEPQSTTNENLSETEIDKIKSITESILEDSDYVDPSSTQIYRTVKKIFDADSSEKISEKLDDILYNIRDHLYGPQKKSSKAITGGYYKRDNVKNVVIFHYSGNSEGSIKHADNMVFGDRFIDEDGDNIHSLIKFTKQPNEELEIRYETTSKRIKNILGVFNDPSDMIKFSGNYDQNIFSEDLNAKFKINYKNFRKYLNSKDIKFLNEEIEVKESVISFEKGYVDEALRKNIDTFKRAVYRKINGFMEAENINDSINDRERKETISEFGNRNKFEHEQSSTDEWKNIPIFYNDNGGEISVEFSEELFNRIIDGEKTELYNVNKNYKLNPLEFPKNDPIIRFRSLNADADSLDSEEFSIVSNLINKARKTDSRIYLSIAFILLGHISGYNNKKYLRQIGMKYPHKNEMLNIKEGQLVEFKRGQKFEIGETREIVEQIISESNSQNSSLTTSMNQKDYRIVLFGVSDEHRRIEGISKPDNNLDGEKLSKYEDKVQDKTDLDIHMEEIWYENKEENKAVLACIIYKGNKNKADMSLLDP